jgi:hypothetical protein
MGVNPWSVRESAPRDNPLRLARYLRTNPVYWRDLFRRPVWASEGYAILWAKVVEAAIAAANHRFPRLGNERLDRDHARSVAIRFLDSDFFRFVCIETNIDPDAAQAAIRRRIPRPEEQKRTRLRRRKHEPVGTVSE